VTSFDAGMVVPDAGVLDAGTVGSDGGQGDGGCSDFRDVLSCQNAGCQPQICPNCITCTSTFMGCADKGVQSMCLLMPCVQECCESDATCPAGLPGSCTPPPTNTCGGTCTSLPSTCVTDNDCAPTEACVQPPCYCAGSLTCWDCAINGCGPGEVCIGSPAPQQHPRCTPISCTSNTECLDDSFRCDGGVCERKTCGSDVECSVTLSSYCVNGLCYPSEGACH
jgi:hypothetical protein